jgi:hypothetical protein
MKDKKNKKTPNPYIRAVVWKVIDIATALLPLLVFILLQWDVYFGKSSEYAWNNILGLGSLAVVVGLAVAKKLKLFGLIGLSGVGWIILKLLRVIILDLETMFFFVFIGALASKLITNPIMRKWERIKDKTETADINAESMEKVVKKIVRSGNV